MKETTGARIESRKMNERIDRYIIYKQYHNDKYKVYNIHQPFLKYITDKQLFILYHERFYLCRIMLCDTMSSCII